MSVCYSKEVLYLRWKEHQLSAYFGTVMTRLQSQWSLLQVVCLCDKDLVTKIC